MIGRKNQWKILLFVTWVACLLFSSIRTFAIFSASDLQFPTDQPQNNKIINLISNYCTQVLQSTAFTGNYFVYNAQQSVFVHLLCRNIRTGSPYFTSQEQSYFKRTGFVQLWFQDIVSTDNYQTDLCDTTAFDNDCDLSVNIPKLFNAIINDYINMKQPNVYGMIANISSDEQKMINQINLYSSGYFDGVQLCTDPRYPKTCQMMKSYMKNVSKVLSDVTILNASGILALSASKAKTVSCPAVTITGDVFYCGLYGDQWASLSSFVNLVYNELFYYRLFMWYYLSMLQAYPVLLADNTYMNDYSTILKTFSTQYMWSKDALSLSLRMMRDIYVAFPFHVWFSMYQEDLNGFWETLAHIVTPIYSLPGKFSHVQKP